MGRRRHGDARERRRDGQARQGEAGQDGEPEAVDDLKTYQEFSQVRLDGLKNLISSFKTLYDSMPADQKKNADHVFDSYGPPKSAQQG